MPKPSSLRRPEAIRPPKAPASGAHTLKGTDIEQVSRVQVGNSGEDRSLHVKCKTETKLVLAVKARQIVGHSREHSRFCQTEQEAHGHTLTKGVDEGHRLEKGEGSY